MRRSSKLKKLLIPMTCGVYKIINKRNGKSYVGASRNIENRWKTHRSAINAKNGRRRTNGRLSADPCWLMEDVLTFGLEVEDFIFLILEISDEQSLFEREKFWIKRFEPVYNSKTCINGEWVYKGKLSADPHIRNSEVPYARFKNQCFESA